MAKDRGGIPTPDVIDPPESMSVTLCIPKNVDHMKAFFGALWQLTMWNSWQPDEAHTGTLLAAVWYRYWLSWDRQMNNFLDCEDGMAKCCVEPTVLHRFNAATGRPEISTDGGENWIPDPADIENEIPLYPPLVDEVSGKTKCDAATNASSHINELIAVTSTNLETAGTVFELATAIAIALLGLFIMFVTGGAASPLVIAVVTSIWAAGTAAFELGKAGFDTYWTVDKQDAILCALYCAIGENGQFTEPQYQNFRAKIKSQLPSSPAFDIVMTSINAGGARGLSQMASYGSAALADCASCGDCVCDVASLPDDTQEGVLGIILERGDCYCIVEAERESPTGNYFATIQSTSSAICYRVMSREMVSGDTFATANWALCGSGTVDSGLFPSGLCVWIFQVASDAPFVVKFNMAECE